MATTQGLQRTFATWSAVSVISGAALWAGGRNAPARRFGRQTFAWGVINAGIAAWTSSRPMPATPRLRRVLLANAVADVGYLAVGAALYRKGLRPDGAAVMVQGGFLLALDTHFAYHLTDSEPPEPWDDVEPDALAG